MKFTGSIVSCSSYGLELFLINEVSLGSECLNVTNTKIWYTTYLIRLRLIAVHIISSCNGTPKMYLIYHLTLLYNFDICQYVFNKKIIIHFENNVILSIALLIDLIIRERPLWII